MAKRLVIDYGTDTLIDLDAPRQNLGQRYNLGGLVRQNYDKAGAVKQAIETDWPKIVKKWNEIFPPKAVESKDADFISLKEFNEPKIPGSGISIDDIMGNLATLAPRPVGKTGQTISDIKMLGRGAEWPDLSQVIIKDKISLDLEPEVLLQELKRTKGNMLDPRWWNGVKQYQLLTGKKFKEIKKDLGYHGDSKTLNDAVKKLNLVDTFDFKVEDNLELLPIYRLVIPA